MKYKISTDEVIIDHIKQQGAGNAILHACVGNNALGFKEGIVTACHLKERMVVLQDLKGEKHHVSFDWISVPESNG